MQYRLEDKALVCDECGHWFYLNPRRSHVILKATRPRHWQTRQATYGLCWICNKRIFHWKEHEKNERRMGGCRVRFESIQRYGGIHCHRIVHRWSSNDTWRSNNENADNVKLSVCQTFCKRYEGVGKILNVYGQFAGGVAPGSRNLVIPWAYIYLRRHCAPNAGRSWTVFHCWWWL